MRWLVSAVVGDGLSVHTAYRAKASDHGDHSALIPGDADGKPVEPWCVVAFRGDEQAAAADPDLVLLPPPDAHTITAAEAASLNGDLARLGCPPGLVTAGMRSDAAARALGRALDDKFDLGWLS